MSRRPFFVGLTAVLAVVLIGIAVQAAFDAEKQSAPPHAARPTAGVAIGPPPLAAVGADTPAGVVGDITTWIEGVQREQERLAADEVARMEAARRSSGPGAAATGSREGVGNCTGFAIPDYIIQRESGGNPYAVNSSSGAFGCAQVMPFHWAPGGACEGLDRWSIDDQRTCVGWLSQDGTRLSPWAATR